MTYVLIVVSLLVITAMILGLLWQLGCHLADRHR